MDFSQLSEADQREMLKVLERKQMQDFLRLYNGLTERCFTDCINDFTSRDVSAKEDACVSMCLEKFMKLSQRIGQRFSEQQALQQGK